MKRNYYCLVAGLQDIMLDAHKLSMGQDEFLRELETELHPADYKLARILFYPIDNNNLLHLLQKDAAEFDPKGIFTQAELEESIKEPTGELPAYMDKFITAYKNNEPVIAGMSSENQITALFYSFTETVENGFLRSWFRFNRNVNNLLTAMVCRKYDIPYENQIIGNDEVSQAIRKSHARDFGLTAELPWLEDLLNISKLENIQEREKAIDNLRWKYLDEETFFEYFTIDKVLTFLIKLGMVERWLNLDREQGMQMFDQLLQELKSSYELPESFTAK